MDASMPRFTKTVTAASAVACFTAFVALTCPGAAFADDAVAHTVSDSGKVTYWYSVDEAITAGYEAKTVVMDADWTLSSTLAVGTEKKLTIDMNGHKISNNSSSTVIRLQEGSNVTFKSSVATAFEYQAYSREDGSAYANKLESGGLITGGNAASGAGGIAAEAESTLTLDNVTVAGNLGSDAGGVTLQKSSKVYLKNGAGIECNRGNAGGIAVTGENAEIHLDNATISWNYAVNFGGGIGSTAAGTKISLNNHSMVRGNSAPRGAGVYFYAGKFEVSSEDKTGAVSYNGNRSGEFSRGGGICVDAPYLYSIEGNGTVKGISIEGNTAGTDGGGVYVIQNGTLIDDCTISGNSAGHDGGGVMSNFCGHIKDCTITGNVCNTDGENYEGGGVFQSSADDVELLGVCVIKDNTRGKNGSADDVFLSANWGASALAYIIGGVEKGSKIGVRTTSTGTRKIAKGLTSNCYGAFFMDLPGYYVGYDHDTYGDMQQNVGTLSFSTSVNGVFTGRYEQGNSVTAYVAAENDGKIFWRWDAEKTTGLYPVSEFITSKNMYSQTLTYDMPQNDVNLVASYADRVQKAIVSVSAPTAGKALPSTVSFRRADSGNGANETIKVPVTWYEVNTDGAKTEASGAAVLGTTYEASFSLEESQELGLHFASDIAAKDVTVAAGINVAKAAAASVDSENGILTVTTPQYVAKKASPFQTSGVAGVEGLKVAKAGKKAVKVTWKKGDRDGVQIRYSLKKSMKSAKKVLVKGDAKTAKKIKKLKSGKKCYFQARAYKVVNGKKRYSAWSKKVNVKVK